MDPITVTIEATRKATGLGTTTIYALINEGKLKTTTVGRRRLVFTQSIRALLGEAA